MFAETAAMRSFNGAFNRHNRHDRTLVLVCQGIGDGAVDSANKNDFSHALLAL